MFTWHLKLTLEMPPPTPLSRTFGRLTHTGKGGTLSLKVEEVPLPSPLHCTFRRLFHTVTSIPIKGGTVRSNAHVDCFFNALPEPSTNQGHGTEHNMIMVVMSTQDILLHHSFDAHLVHMP